MICNAGSLGGQKGTDGMLWVRRGAVFNGVLGPLFLLNSARLTLLLGFCTRAAFSGASAGTRGMADSFLRDLPTEGHPVGYSGAKGEYR